MDFNLYIISGLVIIAMVLIALIIKENLEFRKQQRKQFKNPSKKSQQRHLEAS